MNKKIYSVLIIALLSVNTIFAQRDRPNMDLVYIGEKEKHVLDFYYAEGLSVLFTVKHKENENIEVRVYDKDKNILGACDGYTPTCDIYVFSKGESFYLEITNFENFKTEFEFSAEIQNETENL